MPPNARRSVPLLLALLFAWCGCHAAPPTSPDQGSTTDRPDLATPHRYDFTLQLGTTEDPRYVEGAGTVWAPCDTTGRGLPIGLHFDPPGPMGLQLDGEAIPDSLRYVVVWPTEPCERADGVLASPIAARWAGRAGDGMRIERVDGRTTWTADHWPDRARTYLPVADHPSRASRWQFTIRTSTPSGAGATDVSNRESEYAETRLPSSSWQPSASTAFPAKAVAWVAAPLVLAMDAGRIQAFAAQGEAHAFGQTVTSAPRVLAWMEAEIGPLPVDTLRIVRAGTRYGGMENAGLIVLSGMPSGRDAELLLAHEIAHQWFGTATSEVLWRDLWLSEGAATWWAVRYGEERWGSGWAEAQRAEWRRVDISEPIDSSAHPSDLLADSYALGAARIDALSREIGDAATVEALRRMVRPGADGARAVLSSERLRRIVGEGAAAETGRSVRAGG